MSVSFLDKLYELKGETQPLSENVELSQLAPLQRIILTTDGTLTKVLEAYLLEKIHIIKLIEEKMVLAKDILPLEIQIGEEVIRRTVTLQGEKSLRHWLYAESIIIPERLDTNFNRDLVEQKHVPIGKLWLQHRIEIFKQLMLITRETAGELANYFNIPKEDNLLGRTYCVYSGKRPIMMITDRFPESYFASTL